MPDRDATKLFREEDLSIEYEADETANEKQDHVIVKAGLKAFEHI